MTLRLDEALEAATAARNTATGAGAAVAVVVTDPGGAVVTMQRMDGAYTSAEVIATKKAFTAANFRTATHRMADRLGERQLLIMATDPRLTFLVGGLPVQRDGAMIGAIGVSGGTGDQDLACCRAALAALDADSTE